MSDITHMHTWRERALVDHCHYQQRVDTCDDCGESRSIHRFRDFTDGTQLAFAREDCDTCRKLVVGHGQPNHWSVRI